MNMKSISIGGAALLSAALLAPGLASASYVLDSGTPTSNTGAPVSLLNASQWVAAEFDVTTANALISEVSAYLTVGAGNVGNTFNVDIYSSTSSLTARPLQRAPVYSTSGTFTVNGWNNVATNWTPTATGDYWVALQVSSSQTSGLDLPGAGITTSSAATPSGTAPALAFAFGGTNTAYTVESTSAPSTPFGIQVSQVAPVPLPATAWLLLSGLAGFGGLARRRRAA